MHKKKISQKTPERCLLTEIAPYETPITFSNWGSYNYCKNLIAEIKPVYLTKLFTPQKLSIPYKYRIRKNATSRRTLFLSHPHNSKQLVEFYQTYDVMILKACKRSPFSLRMPHRVARFYTDGKAQTHDNKQIEDISAETAYASSYFTYNRVSHLYKFFESDEFTSLEKKFSQLLYLDISKFFPSLYTHSIAWAMRGKNRTKKRLFKPKGKKDSFDDAFDDLLQQINSKETHGIAIGPELCRIFSEIILQKIDAITIDCLTTKQIRLGVDYWCCRYIDDYFIFFNEEAAKDQFVHILKDELEKYKLFLSDHKLQALSRPFISEVSIQKIAISDFLSDLALRREALVASKAHKEINKLRSLVKNADVPFSNVSGFLLSSIAKQVKSLFSVSLPNKFDALFVLLDLAFHSFRMDIRVSSSYKITSIILDSIAHLSVLELPDQHKIIDKINFEIKGAIESSISQGSSVECMNLLIASVPLVSSQSLSPELIERCITELPQYHSDEYSKIQERLNYFEIVSILYYVTNKPRYQNQRMQLLVAAVNIISEHDPEHYAESMYLLLDLVSCPYLTQPEKDEIIKLAMCHKTPNPLQEEVNQFRNYVATHVWYFNWNQTAGDTLAFGYLHTNPDNLRIHLKKKQFMLAY